MNQALSADTPATPSDPRARGVSAIIPAYNYARYLEGAVRSALAQTHQPVEVLIVDDGSTDDTPRLGARLARELPGVRYIRQENAGLSAARNTGIGLASYPFVTFLDCDDEFLPRMIETLMRAFDTRSPDTGLVACATFRIDTEGRAIGEKRVAPRGSREFTAADILMKTRFPCCVLARRSCFDSAGLFDTALRSSEDRDMWIRIGLRHRIFYVDEQLVRIRRHEGNMSRNAGRMRAAMRRVRRKAFAARVVSPVNVGYWLRMLAIDHFQGGWMFWDEGRRLRALFHSLASLILWPFPLNHRDLHEPPFFRLRAAARFLLGARSAPIENQKSLRVLHIVFSLDAGGMENGIVNISSALSSRGFDFHACCLARGGEFARRFPNPGQVHVIGKCDGFSISTIAALSRHIRVVAPDVIHTHNLGPLIYTALAAPGAKSRILHGEHAELTPAEITPRRIFLRRVLYRRVRRVHAVSDALRENLIRHGLPPQKIGVVVNGVDTSLFSPGPKNEARVQSGLSPDAIVLGLVGRFGEFKRHAELIDAFERLPAMEKKLLLVFIGGDGPREAAIRARAAASPFAPRIVFAGFQSDLRPWYRALDLLVIPSINEGLSNALLESMACGVPALAHTACGSADVITDSADGFLRNLNSPAAIEAALLDALRLPARLPALGEAARRTVESRFSFAAMAAGYEHLYHGLATRPPG